MQPTDVRREGNGGQVGQRGKDRRITKRESGQGGGSQQLSQSLFQGEETEDKFQQSGKAAGILQVGTCCQRNVLQFCYPRYCSLTNSQLYLYYLTCSIHSSKYVSSLLLWCVTLIEQTISSVWDRNDVPTYSVKQPEKADGSDYW